MDRSLASLDGRVAIVTGAGGGIGKGCALGLAAFGANVVVADKVEEAAKTAAAEIEASGVKALPVTIDVREFDAVKAMVRQTVETFGRLDILVNNVGGTFKEDFLNESERAWDAFIRINLKTVFYCTKAASDHMIELGNGGSIINITSIEAWRAAPGFAVYAACKAGVENFTRSTALELAHHNIRVNTIAPDVIDTPGVPLLATSRGDSRRRTIPLGRIGTIEDCAGSTVFLASDMSAFITGSTIHVDGGNNAARGWIRTESGDWSTS